MVVVNQVATGEASDFRYGFTGRSDAIRTLCGNIEGFAQSDASVVLTGESGTGKKKCARAIHDLSARAGAPFVAVNCASECDENLRRHLFSPKDGAALRADGGTLFLDNVCDLNPTIQKRLLEFLNSGNLDLDEHRMARKVDIRLISATSTDPLALVAEGHCREDLFFRLQVLSLHLPPLRERADDILPLATHALTELAEIEGKSFTDFTPEAVQTLQKLAWPGNVRQLRNAIHQIVVMHDGPLVSLDMIPDSALREVRAGDAANGNHETTQFDSRIIGGTLADIEQWAIEETIKLTDGSVPRAARVLDVAPSTLYRKREAWSKKGAR